MQPWHQKNLLGADAPFQLIITDVNEFPPHWHEAAEVVYALADGLQIGVNNEVYELKAREIVLINGGEVHYFLHRASRIRRAVLIFNPVTLDAAAFGIGDRRFVHTCIRAAGELHRALERQILAILDEYEHKREGYDIAIKARLFDFLVALLREVPMEAYSPREQGRRLKRLERLNQVFAYVEENYTRPITLREIAAVSRFSEYYFTRFFRDATGMTFGQYLNHFRVAKAAGYLADTSLSITEIVFKSGFGSVQSFNRVFKRVKGCSPSAYKRAISE